MRIGLFGGTFNPVHLGHLRAALEVKEGFELSKIFLIPAALPPHKIPGDVVDVGDRLQMLNPKWLENERMGRWNRRTPKELRYYRKIKGGGLRIPRGFGGQLMRRLRRMGEDIDEDGDEDEGHPGLAAFSKGAQRTVGVKDMVRRDRKG